MPKARLSSASDVRRLEERVRELELLRGRKTLEVEVLTEALDRARTKKRSRCRALRRGTLSDEGGHRDLGVAAPTSQNASVAERVKGTRPKRGALSDARPTYAYPGSPRSKNASGDPAAARRSMQSAFTG